MQKCRMILWAVNIFSRGFQCLLFLYKQLPLFAVRAAATNSHLSASDLMQMAPFGPLGSNHCLHHHCVLPLGNRWWDRMGAGNRLPAGRC